MNEQLTRESILEIIAEILDDSTQWLLAVSIFEALLQSPQLPLVLLEHPELASDIKRCAASLG